MQGWRSILIKNKIYNPQVFYDKMKDAQQEIKSTVTVNTSDIAAKAHEDKEQSKEIEKISRKRASGIMKKLCIPLIDISIFCLFLYSLCSYLGKPNGIVITDELREELNQAASSTVQAYANVRNIASGEDPSNNAALGSALEDMIAEKLERHRSGVSGGERDEAQLSSKVLVMQPILRFLQLLCENHNRDLQVIKLILSHGMNAMFRYYDDYYYQDIFFFNKTNLIFAELFTQSKQQDEL